MLAKTAKAAFSSTQWIFEIKWDGVRAISYVNEEFSIRSRNNKELKILFPELRELTRLTTNAVLDGEIIVMTNGYVDFETLLKRIQATSSKQIEILQQKHPALYILFDILEKDGESLISRPLIERKRILQETVKEGKNVILSDFVEDKGEAYYQASINKGLEGVMAKKKDSIYTSGKRSANWLKIKKINECDCVIFGYTKGRGNREKTFGAIILGLYDNEIPVYVGKVGTGLNQNTLETLTKKFRNLTTEQKTLQSVDIPNKIHWIKPVLVCKIRYQTVTSDGKLRIPRFIGLREDKKPQDCRLQQIKPTNLNEYLKKRNFKITPEPSSSTKEKLSKQVFVVQEHNARNLHYDLRLEKDGVLKSWAVPKGVPQEQGIRKLAIQTEDHPLGYAKFQGIIPKGQYGAGTVKIWDKGNLIVKKWEKNKIEFKVHGKKLQGEYVLVRFKKGEENNWLLIKVGETK